MMEGFATIASPACKMKEIWYQIELGPWCFRCALRVIERNHQATSKVSADSLCGQLATKDDVKKSKV